jgi:hypothetical protein
MSCEKVKYAFQIKPHSENKPSPHDNKNTDCLIRYHSEPFKKITGNDIYGVYVYPSTYTRRELG